MLSFFFSNDPATTEIYTLSLHDALPIYLTREITALPKHIAEIEKKLISHERKLEADRSEEHTSELQSRRDLVCRLLLEKKKKKSTIIYKSNENARTITRQAPHATTRSAI